MKFSFKNDYSEGCHPKILEALLQGNESVQTGYGEDAFCLKATELLREKIALPEAKIFFVSGGTQANLVVISSLLRPHESVISAETGHIFNNEAGAIEATGHKVHALPTTDGKITPEKIRQLLDTHRNVPHQVKPRLVYISNATELGTVYQRDELEALSIFCRQNKLLLFLDGARLSQALAADKGDLTAPDIARLTDVFYWGATKNGGLLGEAVIFGKPQLAEDFGFHLKQKGALLAKGRLLGVQFSTLFTGDLEAELARKANAQAMKIKKVCVQSGISFLTETSTNQLFPIFTDSQIERLATNFEFYVWKKIDAKSSAVRFITSWATRDAAVEALCAAIREVTK